MRRYDDGRAMFDSLLSKTHVAHALIQPDGEYNSIPTSLAALLHLHATPAQLHAVYGQTAPTLEGWPTSPGRIATLEDRAEHLGDSRYQRAYMDYFSAETLKLGGNCHILTLSHLTISPQPLLLGLFSNLGHPLIHLSDGLELQSAVLITQSLVMASASWDPLVAALLLSAQPTPPPTSSHISTVASTTTSTTTTTTTPAASPAAALSFVATDPRLGAARAGERPLADAAARAAVGEHLAREPRPTVARLARLAALLLCGTHKRGRPAFDARLAALPPLANALRVLLGCFPDGTAVADTLARGVWLVMVLAYVTQLRPVVDEGLVVAAAEGEGEGEGAPGGVTWQGVSGRLRAGMAAGEEKFRDVRFLRAVRSLSELGQSVGKGDPLYLRAAWKLLTQWKGWVGTGGAGRGETLNIRL